MSTQHEHTAHFSSYVIVLPTLWSQVPTLASLAMSLASLFLPASVSVLRITQCSFFLHPLSVRSSCTHFVLPAPTQGSFLMHPLCFCCTHFVLAAPTLSCCTCSSLKVHRPQWLPLPPGVHPSLCIHLVLAGYLILRHDFIRQCVRKRYFGQLVRGSPSKGGGVVEKQDKVLCTLIVAPLWSLRPASNPILSPGLMFPCLLALFDKPNRITDTAAACP